MRRLVLGMSMSVDGFVCGPDGESDWMIRGRSEGGKAWVADGLRQAGLIAMGSRSYFDMAGYWPNSTDLLAGPMNETPKVIFTRQQTLALPAAESPNAASWAEARIANGDLATEIGRLKQEPGRDIVACGGAGFAQSLARSGLVDEYRLAVHPVALGAGRPLFTELPGPLNLRLISTSIFATGVIAQIYRPG